MKKEVRNIVAYGKWLTAELGRELGSVLRYGVYSGKFAYLKKIIMQKFAIC